MALKTWGNVVPKKTSGGGDANIYKLEERNEFRIVGEGGVAWRQHYIENASDDEQGRSIVCPRGYDGSGRTPCPLCMKNNDEKGNQRFSIAKRHATNIKVKDTGEIKVLIGGPQIFNEFEEVASEGMNPMHFDWIVKKTGKNKQTEYKTTRGKDHGEALEIAPGDLHDLDKYEKVPTTAEIFELLTEMGVDYDSLKTPSFTLEEAEDYKMPFGKHKDMTAEQVVTHDRDYAEFMTRKMAEGGDIASPVYIALYTVLNGESPEDPEFMESTSAAPEPQKQATEAKKPAPQPTAPKSDPKPASGLVTLYDKDGVTVEVPEATVDAMTSTGLYSVEDPTAPPAPEPSSTTVTLYDKDGKEQLFPAAVKETMLGTGDWHETAPEPEAEQVTIDLSEIASVEVDVGGNVVEVPTEAAIAMHGAGTATFIDPAIAAAVEALADPVNAEADAPESDEKAEVLPEGIELNAKGRYSCPSVLGSKSYAKLENCVKARDRELEKPAEDAAPAADGDESLSPKDALLAQLRPRLEKYGKENDFASLLGIFKEVSADKTAVKDMTEAELSALLEHEALAGIDA